MTNSKASTVLHSKSLTRSTTSAGSPFDAYLMSLQVRRPFCTNWRIMLIQKSGSFFGLPFSSTPSDAFSSCSMNFWP